MALHSIWSQKFGETVSYYSEDLDYCGGKWIAPGVGDDTGEEYDVLFEENDMSFSLRTIVKHNESE